MAYLQKSLRCQFENTQFQGDPDLNYPRKCSGNNIHNPFISHLNAFSAVNKFSWNRDVQLGSPTALARPTSDQNAAPIWRYLEPAYNKSCGTFTSLDLEIETYLWLFSLVANCWRMAMMTRSYPNERAMYAEYAKYFQIEGLDTLIVQQCAICEIGNFALLMQTKRSGIYNFNPSRLH